MAECSPWFIWKLSRDRLTAIQVIIVEAERQVEAVELVTEMASPVWHLPSCPGASLILPPSTSCFLFSSSFLSLRSLYFSHKLTVLLFPDCPKLCRQNILLFDLKKW